MKLYNEKLIIITCVIFLLFGISGCAKKEVVAKASKETPIGYNDSFYSTCFVNKQVGWAVGYYGIVAHTEDGGKSWIRQDSGSTDPLLGVSFVDEKNGWVVGDLGTILHTADGGESFEIQKSPFEDKLFDVKFVDSANGWAVGYGAILHTADGGKTWEQQGEYSDAMYNSLWFTDEVYGWVVGEFNTILHTQDGGLTWTQQQSPLTSEFTFYDIQFSDRKRGVAVGLDGAIVVTEDGGETWESATIPGVTDNFYSVRVIDDKAWACGFRGIYVYTNHGLKDWVVPKEEFAVKYWQSDLDFADAKHGWIVGAHGILRRTTDGGTTWQ